MLALIDGGSATAARNFVNVKCDFMLRAQIEDHVYLVLGVERGSFLKFLDHRLHSLACSPCLVPLVFAFHSSL